MSNQSAFLIAAPRSNSGKTMLTLGLMQALVRRGLKVQPFKCGPDYIDPMHHSIVAGRASYNLDVWMAKKEHVHHLFEEKGSMVDVSVVEGVMGLFDGAVKDQGSSAQLAKALNLPVILVVDASSTAYSVAPLLYGFKNFDLAVQLAGVIFNKVASVGHYQFLKEAALDAGVRILGYLPRDQRLAIESRHLGLHLPGENKNQEIVQVAADLIEEHVDLSALLSASKRSFRLAEKTNDKENGGSLKIALARDEAFNFSYQANIDALKQLGELNFFSPLHDEVLPDADLVWLPGGYPELFTELLAGNYKMKEAIRRHVEADRKLIAECGGMMYLGKELVTKDGVKSTMAGIFDYRTSFENSKLHLGYRKLQRNDMFLKGHEFHYSNLEDGNSEKEVWEVQTARQKEIEMPVFRYKSCWASYLHLYLGEPKRMKEFIKHLSE